MPTLAEARALFDRRLRAWLDGDVGGYLALWAPDMEFGSPLHPEPLRGREAYATLVRRSMAAARPVGFAVAHMAVEGELVLAEWTMTIERRADGRRITWRGMSVCAIRDGLIRWWREYWNPAAFT